MNTDMHNTMKPKSRPYRRLYLKALIIGALIELPLAAALMFGNFGMHSPALMLLGMLHLPSSLIVYWYRGLLPVDLPEWVEIVFALAVPIGQILFISLVAFLGLVIWEREKERAGYRSS